MNFNIVKATKIQSKARIGIVGPAGSGKTYTALSIGTALGQRVAVIDTENASAAKYASLFDFDVLVLDTFSPRTYVQAIQAVEQAGYDVLIIDSLSHAWAGRGGALEMVDQAAKRSSGNNFAAWRDVTPEHNRLVDALVRCSSHLIVTMRSKMEYVLDRDEKTGRTSPRKVGMAPIQRDGLEYEFDIAGDMDLEHNWVITKTRCPALDGSVINRPGKDVAKTISAWLSDGATVTPAAPAEQPTRRDKLINRICELTSQGQAVEIEVALAKPISEMTDDELVEHGKKLSSALARHAAQDLAPQRGVQEESLPATLPDVRGKVAA
jgi:hypothetical protein